MKILFVYGSTRPGSVSAKVLDEIARGAAEAGHEIVRYNLGDMPLCGCHGCKTCRNTKSDCCLQDGLTDYFKQIWDAGAVVVGAPMYMGQAAGQNITFMNRHYCLKDAEKQARLPAGKKAFVVFSQGAPANFARYLPAQDWYLGCFATYGMDPVGKLVVGGNSDLSPEGEVMRQAYAVGKGL